MGYLFVVIRRFTFTCLLSLFLALLAEQANAEIKTIWLVDDGEKIKASDLVPPQSQQEPKIELFGMKNEILAFQVVLQADEAGVQEVFLKAPDIPTFTIEIFREDYVEIKERSHGLVWKARSKAEPTGFKGLVPDRLVPLQKPVAIASGENQAFWVDIWISPDAKPGTHSKHFQIFSSKSCARGCDILVEIEVLDLRMPDKPYAKTMLWFSGGEDVDRNVHPRYFADPKQANEAEKQALRLAHYQLAKKHRITLFAGNHDAQSPELADLLSGSAYSKEQGYTGPGQNIGQDILVFHAYGGELNQQEAKEWLQYSKGFTGLSDVFVYVLDEPRQEDWKEVNRRAQVSKPMPSFVTAEFKKELSPDIFAALASLYKSANALAARQNGKKLWIYNGVRPFSGSFAIDDVAISPRVNPWIQYKAGIERWFYWESTYYHDFQGQRGAIDVAKQPINFTNRHGDRVNGDGLLFYPGRDYLFPQSDLEINAPLPSIRLKNWRRGIQDVEYLVMANAAGFGTEVNALLQALLPASLDQAREEDAVSWNESGQTWLKARRYLSDLLKSGQSSVNINALKNKDWKSNKNLLPSWLPIIIGVLLALLFTLWRVRKKSQ